MYLIVEVMVNWGEVVSSLGGQDLALERACHLDMFASGQLGAHNLAEFNSWCGTEICRFSLSWEQVSSETARCPYAWDVMMPLLRIAKKCMFWKPSQWNWIWNTFQKFFFCLINRLCCWLQFCVPLSISVIIQLVVTSSCTFVVQGTLCHRI